MLLFEKLSQNRTFVNISENLWLMDSLLIIIQPITNYLHAAGQYQVLVWVRVQRPLPRHQHGVHPAHTPQRPVHLHPQGRGLPNFLDQIRIGWFLWDQVGSGSRLWIYFFATLSIALLKLVFAKKFFTRKTGFKYGFGWIRRTATTYIVNQIRVGWFVWDQAGAGSGLCFLFFF
jgi:hypothetical protein